MLSIKTRQKYLKALGLYNGSIDGVEGKLTKGAYKLLQNKFFARRKDVDGKYGNNTDILLQSAYNLKDSKYFSLPEFKCHCNTKYCTGYPAVVSKDLVDNLDKLRKWAGAPIVITSPLRCLKWNALQGGVSSSYHTKGKATDIYCSKYSHSLESRKKMINKFLTYSNSNMGYCNGYMKYKGGSIIKYTSKTMGNATHIQVN